MTKRKKSGIFMSFFILFLTMCGCGRQTESQADTLTEMQTQTESDSTTVVFEETEPGGREMNILDELGTADQSYTCGDYSVLNSYNGKSAEKYKELCSYFVLNGYEEYCSSERNENLFATYVNGDALACVYWLKDKEELNLITSDTAGGNLPPMNPEVTDGNVQTTVVQLHQTVYENGMGYVIRLADGSFLIYDGGQPNMADELYQTLCELNGGEENIVIRAWMLTHSHEDHYRGMYGFFTTYADKVELEYLLIAPLFPGEGFISSKENYILRKFPDVKICVVHTGMIFNFCNLKMEILFSPEELYIDETPSNYNNSSIVSKVYSDDYSMIFLADTAKQASAVFSEIYGSYLKSDMCQAAHHGVDNNPLSLYELIEANILWYPCNRDLYQDSVNYDVRMALKDKPYTKEILLQDEERHQRDWGYISEVVSNSYESSSNDHGAVEESELLYTVDFRGNDGIFIPGPIGESATHYDYTVSEDGNALTIKGRKSGTNKTFCYWGGTFAGFEANKETMYTMVYKAKANGTAGKDNSVGIGGWILDGKPEDCHFYNNYSNHSEMNAEGSIDDRRSALSNASNKLGEYVMWNNIGDYAVDADGFVTIKIVYDGTTSQFQSAILAANAGDGSKESDWIYLETQKMVLDDTDDAMGFMVYSYYNVVDTTIKDVQLYKGTCTSVK